MLPAPNSLLSPFESIIPRVISPTFWRDVNLFLAGSTTKSFTNVGFKDFGFWFFMTCHHQPVPMTFGYTWLNSWNHGVNTSNPPWRVCYVGHLFPRVCLLSRHVAPILRRRHSIIRAPVRSAVSSIMAIAATITLLYTNGRGSIHVLPQTDPAQSQYKSSQICPFPPLQYSYQPWWGYLTQKLQPEEIKLSS